MSPQKVALVGADNERTHEMVAEFTRLAAEAGGDADIVWVDSEQDEAGLVAGIGDSVAIIHGFGAKLPADVLRQTPSVKLVQTMSAGTDYVDKPGLHAINIGVANNGGGNAVAVAEHAIWLMIAVYRRLDEQIRDTAAGLWGKNVSPHRDEAHDLSDKTVGIVGLGRIGSRVARRLQGWECRVIYHDVIEFPEEYERELEVERVPFDELVATSDVITLHTPLEPTTRHLMSTDQFKAMKSSAVLINSCRGPVVDEAALVEALKTGEIYGAGLDVYEIEPIEMDNPLFKLENVVMTPHLATRAIESIYKTMEFAAGNVSRVARGEAPESIVPPVEM
ncbi:MAG: 2-hydroxyacid dehydrogenase [Chloroflexi bacterium]|nr:2-hydroxyacid dehydrogenase [Chloroflexota bacterium]